jgi:CopG antitoxin of type II toxin-antitoxin system
MGLVISAKTRTKLAEKHCVSPDEVRQAFADHPGYVLLDTREDHASEPPTVWFIGSTYHGRFVEGLLRGPWRRSARQDGLRAERSGEAHLLQRGTVSRCPDWSFPMSKVAPPKLPGTDEAWEQGELGRDAAHAQRIDLNDDARARLDQQLNLQPISIRLPVELLDDLKAIAKKNGLGYQPLIRQVLTRFAGSELKSYAREALAAERAACKPAPKATEARKKAA